MNSTRRRAWTELITAADFDDHMHNVGQAEANASLMQAMLAAGRLSSGNRVLIAGAGTAQFLDYVSGAKWTGYDLTLSDINRHFLAMARQRFRRAGLSQARFVVDDLEATRLVGPFDAAVLALVLEHIDWQLGLRNIHKLDPAQMHIVIQQKPARLNQAIAPQHKLKASMQVLANTARPTLIGVDELVEYLGHLGYRLKERHERVVPDNKIMLGLIFARSDAGQPL